MHFTQIKYILLSVEASLSVFKKHTYKEVSLEQTLILEDQHLICVTEKC